MSNKRESLVNAPGDLFRYLESEWHVIAKNLTASFSIRLKKELRDKFASDLPNIDAKITACAEANNGAEANQWRHAYELILSVTSELSMWIALANNDVNAAWNHFSDAESSANRLLHWLPEYDLAQRRVIHLSEVERIGFPHQEWFFSTGMIVSKGICTICNSEYGTCGHLALELYDGKMAARRVVPKEMLEVSFVNNPADKRCRMLSAGGIDPLTGEPSKAASLTSPSRGEPSVNSKAPNRRRKRRR